MSKTPSDENTHAVRQVSVIKRLFRPVVALFSIASAVVTILTIYLALPSFSLAQPSASYRPENPFKAIFTLTNNGYLPGMEVMAACLVRKVDYAEPLGGSSSNLPSSPTSLGEVKKNESRSYVCPQLVTKIEIFNRVLTPDEIHRLSDPRNPVKDDMNFKQADIEIKVTYRMPIIGLHLNDKFHVIGKPSASGTIVWEQVPWDAK